MNDSKGVRVKVAEHEIFDDQRHDCGRKEQTKAILKAERKLKNIGSSFTLEICKFVE